jgi:hypothetical protein
MDAIKESWKKDELRMGKNLGQIKYKMDIISNEEESAKRDFDSLYSIPFFGAARITHLISHQIPYFFKVNFLKIFKLQYKYDKSGNGPRFGKIVGLTA